MTMYKALRLSDDTNKIYATKQGEDDLTSIGDCVNAVT